MSVIVLGLSHRSAPMSLLEAATLTKDQVGELACAVRAGENVTEAIVVATCNRVEVYAAALTFHGALTEISTALEDATGLSRNALSEHLYVHYEDRAIAHAFSVACGLDSMAIGETQILGQLRDALGRAQQGGHVGAVLNSLFQQALRVGRRAHAETDLDRVSASLLGAGLHGAAVEIGPLTHRRALVVGAGSMSGLAAATLARTGVAGLTVVSRTAARADRLADQYGGRVAPLSELGTELATADLVVSCTGAVGHVVTEADARAAAQQRARSQDSIGATHGGGGQVYLDLALPRDVDPAVRHIPGVTVIGLAELAQVLAGDRVANDDLRQVRDLVTAEVAGFLLERRAQEVGPTVAALRSQAARVVAAELDRLDARLPHLSDTSRAEVRRTVHRVVEKLLHTPTVRVKELVGTAEAGDYAHALRELFDLDPHDIATVSSPPDQGMP